MFELIFFSSHLPALYFFPFNYRLFSTLISNVVKKKKKKKKNTTTIYLFQCPKHIKQI